MDVDSSWRAPLSTTPDANGLLLPAGFTSRVVARGNAAVIGGWILVVNSEVLDQGGVSALRFAPDGTIVDAYRILSGTSTNCAGGATPWNAWLSCEEVDRGRVWECDPAGQQAARVLPALGTFKHEAAAVDPQRRCRAPRRRPGAGRRHCGVARHPRPERQLDADPTTGGRQHRVRWR